jgi:hypothetical protein
LHCHCEPEERGRGNPAPRQARGPERVEGAKLLERRNSMQSGQVLPIQVNHGLHGSTQIKAHIRIRGHP